MNITTILICIVIYLIIGAGGLFLVSKCLGGISSHGPEVKDYILVVLFWPIRCLQWLFMLLKG